MKTKALVCCEDQSFALAEVGLPDPGPGDLVIRTLCSGVSIGTEFALIRNRISWGPYPLCTGYQAVGVVEEVGCEVDEFKPGDRVYYRGQPSMALADGRTVSTVSGAHAAYAVTRQHPTHGIAALPEGVPEEAGSCFVMPAVGLVGVDMAQPKVTDAVVVYGVGAIGLGAVAWLAMRGCTVIAVDIDDARLAIARRLGADHTVNASAADVEAEVARLCPRGADVVFEASGNRECVNPAIRLCKPHGKFVWQGNYGAEPLAFEFLPAHGRLLTMFFPCDDGYGPNRRAVMKHIASGALRWSETITHRIGPDEAPAFFDEINRGTRRDVVQAVIRWSD